jgi:uncharacterized protein YjdB
MSNSKRKLPLLAGLAVLLSLAAAVSCKGFFVNAPTAVTVTPGTASLTFGQSQQLAAQATFNSGSPQDVTKSATWQSSNGCAVSVSTQTLGQVTAVGTGGSVTITALFNGVSGTATVTPPTGLTISPCGSFKAGSTQSFTANNNGTDVTGSSTWSSSDSNIVKFANANSPVATFGPNTGTVTITANDNTLQGQLQVTVTP